MIKADKYYIKNLNEILTNGCFDESPRPKYKDGTPAYTKYITQVFEEYDISKGEFPITTFRNIAIKSGIKEIFWIYQMQSNKLKDLHDLNVYWWDEFNIGDGTIGQRYGATVKRYNLMDNLLDGLINEPFSRRHIINLYQENDLKETKGLYPCAFETNWSVRKFNNEYYLDMTLFQRSSDYLTANMINKGQYLAFQMMVAGHCNYKVGKFCHIVQNLHVYDRHFKFIDELLKSERLDIFPRFELMCNKNFYNYKLEDFNFFDFDKLNHLSNKLEIAI